jgi:hypothetical protein
LISSISSILRHTGEELTEICVAYPHGLHELPDELLGPSTIGLEKFVVNSIAFPLLRWRLAVRGKEE